ncbi:baseplate J/gp47 family protein [Teredinibacter sp. KSP-S5-2]|uniref:baseplate assembly protein n=1 Tax=Teredinibacter sp. KSP-S5-2 TaxID=3034506 RepID=UPI0029349CA3|nr:baseplate J/gp47 family protein [Teredinibacter sp. KSP-S5-2]WNO10438.1 baseplate J/gp47 family protein [Teredinibacter sp. KSP-S5-2]
MSQFSAIDLEKLPAPDVIETLDFETIFSALLAELTEAYPEFSADVESDPAYKILQVSAYRELMLRAEINDRIKALLLAYARGANLDHIVASYYRLQREIVSPGDESAIPPVAPKYEDDDRLRYRSQLSYEGYSTAGPEGSYIFHALAASPLVKDASVQSPTPGVVVVTVLSNDGAGIASDALLQTVNAHLNDKTIRPLTDQVLVQSAEVIPFTVEAELILFSGPDESVVEQAALIALDDYLNARHRLGHDITLSGMYAALHQPGVQQVNLLSPAQNILVQRSQVAWNTEKKITLGGRGE